MLLSGKWGYDICKYLVHCGHFDNLIDQVHTFTWSEAVPSFPWQDGAWESLTKLEPWSSIFRGNSQVLLLSRIAARDLIMISYYLRYILTLSLSCSGRISSVSSVLFTLLPAKISQWVQGFREKRSIKSWPSRAFWTWPSTQASS